MGYSKLLKVCPHCSSNNLVIKHSKKGYKIKCLECGATGGRKDTKLDAVASWNMRWSHEELFKRMLVESEYCTDYATRNTRAVIHGDPTDIDVVTFLSQNNSKINAIFLSSTQDLLLFEAENSPNPILYTPKTPTSKPETTEPTSASSEPTES